jgi:UDP-N-acetylmuramyl pentapeptide phosphotransferase/UDP-N-acetylglucosamine-1-phosphate transferase
LRFFFHLRNLRNQRLKFWIPYCTPIQPGIMIKHMKFYRVILSMLLLTASLMSPVRVLAQSDLEQRVSRLENRVSSQEGVGVAVFVCAAFSALWAQNTDRNPWLWFFLGVFFSVITVLVLLWKNADDRKRTKP